MKKLVKLAIICIAIAVLVLAIDYVIFHYVTIPDGKAGRSRQTVGHTTCLAVCRAVFVAWHGKPSCGVCAPGKERQLAHKNHKHRENLGQNTSCRFSLFLQKFVVIFNYIWQNALYVFDGILCNVVVFPLLVAYTTMQKLLLLVTQATRQKPLFFPNKFCSNCPVGLQILHFFCQQITRSFS